MLVNSDSQQKEPKGKKFNSTKVKKVLIFLAIVLLMFFMEFSFWFSRMLYLTGFHTGYIEKWIKSDIFILIFLIIALVYPVETLYYSTGKLWNNFCAFIYKKMKVSRLSFQTFKVISVVVAGLIIPVVTTFVYIMWGWEYIDIPFEMIPWFAIIWVIFVVFHLMDKVENSHILLVISLVFITGVAFWSLMLRKGYFYSILLAISLNIAWVVWYCRSDRNDKKRMVIENIVANLLILFAFGTFYDSFVSFDRWYNPEIYGQTDFIGLQQAHSLKLLSLDFKYVCLHPFSAVYTQYGPARFWKVIAAFILVSVLIIYSGKLVSKKRHNIMLTFYIMWAVIFVFNLLGDLGFVPSIVRNPISHEPVMYEMILVLRMLRVRPHTDDLFSLSKSVE